MCITIIHGKFIQLEHIVMRRHCSISNLGLISCDVISSESSLIGQNCFSAMQRCTTALTNGNTDNKSSD